MSRRAAGAIADPRKLYIDQAKKKAAPVDSDVDFDDSPAPTAKAAPKARAARTTRAPAKSYKLDLGSDLEADDSFQIQDEDDEEDAFELDDESD